MEFLGWLLGSWQFWFGFWFAIIIAFAVDWGGISDDIFGTNW